MANISISASPIYLHTALKQPVVSHTPASPRNAGLDQVFYPNPFKISVILTGVWGNLSLFADPIVITTTIVGPINCTWTLWGDVDRLPIVITTILAPASIDLGANKSNWIKWSDIGSLDFTISKSNVAGERPMDWSGWVYRIMKLGSRVVVYGENGVSLLTPVGAVFGLNTIYKVGLKGKHAAIGDDTKHFFLDSYGQLWKLTDTLRKLDYSEFLSSLNSNVVMSYDVLNNLVYICDGYVGFIYDVTMECLGQGQANIAGVGWKNGVQYVTADAEITTDPFEICTDIYDLGTRASKTISWIEFGTDLKEGLYAAVDYRRDKSDDFQTTPWQLVRANGCVPITAYGVEFRFRVKTIVYESFELDYIKVDGVVNAY